jgi:hypothetical protein
MSIPTGFFAGVKFAFARACRGRVSKLPPLVPFPQPKTRTRATPTNGLRIPTCHVLLDWETHNSRRCSVTSLRHDDPRVDTAPGFEPTFSPNPPKTPTTAKIGPVPNECWIIVLYLSKLVRSWNCWRCQLRGSPALQTSWHQLWMLALAPTWRLK